VYKSVRGHKLGLTMASIPPPGAASIELRDAETISKRAKSRIIEKEEPETHKETYKNDLTTSLV